MFAKIPGFKVIFFHPGRLKVRIDSLKGQRPLGVQTAKELSANQAVKKIAVDPAKGDVLIQYDREMIKDPSIVDQLAASLKKLYPELDIDALRGKLLD